LTNSAFSWKFAYEILNTNTSAPYSAMLNPCAEIRLK
jgi:hypothetical protein